MTLRRLSSIARFNAHLPLGVAVQGSYNVVGTGFTNSGKPACPITALPLLAYRAFYELRRNLHVPDEALMNVILAIMTAASQMWVRVKCPHNDKPEIVSQGFYACVPPSVGISELTHRLYKPFRASGLDRLKKHKAAEKDRSDKEALRKAKRKGLLNHVTRLYARNINADDEDIGEVKKALASLQEVEVSAKSPLPLRTATSVIKLLAEVEGTNVPIFWTSDHGHQFLGRMTSDELEYMAQIYDGGTLNYETLRHSGVVDQALVTTCVMTALGVIEKFFKKKCDDARTGLITKGLLSRAVPGDQYSDSAIMDPTWTHSDLLNARSTGLVDGYYDSIADATFSPEILEFNAEAKKCFMELMELNRYRMSLQHDWAGIDKFAHRHALHVAKIAAVFHFFGDEPGTLITLETLKNAIEIVDWYMEQAKHMLVTEPRQKQLERLVTFLHTKCFIQRKHLPYTDNGNVDLIPIRFIMQFHNIYEEPLMTLLRLLSEVGTITFQTSYSGKQCIQLNAALFATR